MPGKRSGGRSIDEDAWKGFITLRDVHGKVKNAKCRKCNMVYTKRDRKTLDRHREKCHNNSEVVSSEEEEHTESTISQTDPETPTPPKRKLPNHKSNEDVQPGCSGKQQSIGSASNEDIAKKRNEQNILFLNVLLRFGIDIDDAQSVHLSDLFQSFDPSFTVPSPVYLKTKVLPLAYTNLLSKNLEKDISKIIIVQSTDIGGNESCVIGAALTGKKSYVYLDATLIDYLDRESLENFCDTVVEKLYADYNIQCKFIIYDDNVELGSTGTVGQIKYHRVRCCSVLIDKLTNDHGSFEVRNLDELNSSKIYYEYVQKLERKISSMSLSDATKAILDFSKNENIRKNNRIETLISDFLSPVSFASMFFNYQYQFQHLQGSQQEIVYDFFTDLFSDRNNFTHCSDYVNKTGVFRKLFDPDNNYDPQKFWLVASMKGVSLSNIALDFLSLPAIPRKIDPTKVTSSLRNLQNNEGNVKALFMSLILQES